ncbi:MAG: hypothetical protein WC005_01105 [Candidatus Nanopelagicales bacterium]
MSTVITSSSAWLALARFRLRLDRLRIASWVIAGVVLTATVASTWDSLYPTAQERVDFAATLQAAPALTALLGPLQAPTSTGGLTTWRVGGLSVLMIGIVIVFLVIRHTRTDMSASRTDLILSGRLPRRSVISSGVVPAMVMSIGIGAACALALGASAGGWISAGIYGLSVAGSLVLFAAIASLIAQAVNSSRGANGIGVLVVSLAFVLTAIGNTRDVSALAEMTPFGWMAKASPYAQDMWGWAVLPFLVAGVVMAVSLAVASGRDVGSAWTTEGLGRERAPAWLSHPQALIWRVDRGVIVGWFIGIFAMALFMGYFSGSLTEILAENPQMAELIARLSHGEPSATFTKLILVFAALGAAGFPISILVRTAVDENEGRIELMLSTRMSRVQLLRARLAEVVVGSVLLLMVVGMGVGVVSGFFTDSRPSALSDGIGLAMVSLPAVWFIAALTALIVAISPRLAWLGWLLLAWCVVVGELAPLMNLPSWTERLSPYWYSPEWPITGDVWQSIAMTVASAVLMAMSFIVFARRRIPH